MTTTKTKPPTTELKALPNGRTAWRCPSCNAYSSGGQLHCGSCDALRADLSDEAHMLIQALEPDRETADVWQDLAGVLTADSKLETAIHEALIRQAGQSVSTDRGPVCWVTGPEHEALAGSMGFWFGRQVPPETSDPPPDLIGADLLGAVRELYGIPRPGPHPRPRKAGAGKPEAVRNRKSAWSQTELELLGKKPDADVAKLTGRSRRAVQTKRNKLGIPEFNGQSGTQETRRKPVAKKKSAKKKATRKAAKSPKSGTKKKRRSPRTPRPVELARASEDNPYAFNRDPRLVFEGLLPARVVEETGIADERLPDEFKANGTPFRVIETWQREEQRWIYVFEVAERLDGLRQPVYTPALMPDRIFDRSTEVMPKGA